ncbi:MAG: ATP phosphoribosyltransferase regulatory subunit [Venatoribacter sp.]
MKRAERWLLPDGIEEILPPEAFRIEQLRRHLLDLLDSWGYDLVMPPALEYLDSLLTGTGKNLDLRTFKVTDQLSGRMMGLSADTTPQVARIDAHSLAPEGISRLCYCRTVFHAKARSLLASRTPTQIGAELYGDSSSCAEVEIISLMLSTLQASEIGALTLDLGHVGVFKILSQEAGLTSNQLDELLELLKLKSTQDIALWAEREINETYLQQAFIELAKLQGNTLQVQAGLNKLVELVPAISSARDTLLDTIKRIQSRFPNTQISLDLTELRGLNYHTGVVFAAYVPGFGDAVAKGGRYDENGAVFGRARPAIGFSADLKVLARFGAFKPTQKPQVIAPNDDDPSLWAQINELRAQGYRVQTDCEQQPSTVAGYLKNINGQWQLVKA